MKTYSRNEILADFRKTTGLDSAFESPPGARFFSLFSVASKETLKFRLPHIAEPDVELKVRASFLQHVKTCMLTPENDPVFGFEALSEIDLRFRSGNSVEPDRVSVPRHEWEAMKDEIRETFRRRM